VRPTRDRSSLRPRWKLADKRVDRDFGSSRPSVSPFTSFSAGDLHEQRGVLPRRFHFLGPIGLIGRIPAGPERADQDQRRVAPQRR
jgi:hypothetical protein